MVHGHSTQPVKQYLELLTQRVAAAIRAFSVKNFSFCPPLNPRVNTLAAQHRHKKRQQPLPEFAATHWQPTETRLTDSQKIIPSSLRGEY